jgi:hypothetical protein
VADGGDANGSPIVGQLVEDSVGAYSQRIETAQLASECMPDAWLAL